MRTRASALAAGLVTALIAASPVSADRDVFDNCTSTAA
jgi:hypothetical protein